jgi:hypothetical protein
MPVERERIEMVHSEVMGVPGWTRTAPSSAAARPATMPLQSTSLPTTTSFTP